MRKMRLYRLASFLCFLLIVPLTHLFAQNQTIKGVVTDNTGKGVPGVTVTVKGTSTATQTDGVGAYTITAPANSTLVFSSVGYTSLEMAIAGRTNFDTQLASAPNDLSEVVVIGYGTARKRDVTGSVASVRAKDFNKGVLFAPDQLIQGKVAGVQVINNSGQPGGATTVRIRGAATIRSGQQPLFVIDGVPLSGSDARPGFSGGGIGNTPGTNPLNFINPNDIASMEVLKDASAAAIYGSRGANGVIIITTKRGLSGAPVIEFGTQVGISSVLKQLEVLNASEYRAALRQYNLTGGDFGSDVNAFDAITQRGLTQNHNFAVSGGNENARYRFSGSYLNQEGIIRETGVKKYTVGLNTNFKFLESRRIGLDFSVLAAHQTEEIAPISNDAGFTGSLVGQALQWNPTAPLIKPGTDSAFINPAVGATTINPLAMLAYYDDNANTSTILATISPYFKITNDLEYRFQYSVTRGSGVRRTQVNRIINIENIQNRGFAAIGNSDRTDQQLTHTLNYNKQVGTDFSVNGTVGYEFLKYDSRGFGVSGFDFPNVGLDYYDFLNIASQTSVRYGSGANPTTEIQSYFARGIFTLKNKYSLTATFRADGSTRFGENNKYGYFPSVAAGWTISNEDFLRGNRNINSLKLRASWGRTGNQEFPSGASLDRFVVTQSSTPTNLGTFGQANFGNRDLKWETTTTTNFGLDFGLFSDRISGSLDYFIRKTTDVLFEQNIIQPGPGGRIWINLPGNVENRGLEVAVNTAIIRGRDLNLNFGVNATFLKNNVEGILGFYETGGLSGQGISGTASQRIVSGQPLNVFYLRQFTGIDRATGQSQYVDDGNTLFYSGSPNPTTLMGLTAEVGYKRLSATFNMNGAFGQVLYNNTANTVLPIGNLGTRNIARSLLGTGVQEALANPIAASTRYLEKGDYMKMANATIAYRLGAIRNVFSNVTVSLTGQNLFVLTDYSGFDPEVNTDKSIGGIPSLGIEYTPYPSARTILLGLTFSLR